MTATGALLLGVDGGGTKTDVVLADDRGTELAAVRTGGSNHEDLGTAKVVATLHQAVDEVLAAAGAAPADVAVAVFGLAGIDWPGDVTEVGGALHELGLGGTTIVVNDSEVALRAGCGQPWGVVSSVGTGTVTAGVNRAGQRFRTMAVGFGEPSGSGSIVRAVLDAVAAAHHGTGPTTALEAILLEAFDRASVPALFEAITRGRLEIGAGHAPLLDRAVERGDEVALAVLDDVARRHADMVGAVARRLHMVDDDFELVMAGGVHLSSVAFGERFRARVGELCPDARPALLTVPPVRGAVRLALDALTTQRGEARPRAW
jgi:N-acetylglucosamine kinase-like BadF-type ATPase